MHVSLIELKLSWFVSPTGVLGPYPSSEGSFSLRRPTSLAKASVAQYFIAARQYDQQHSSALAVVAVHRSGV